MTAIGLDQEKFSLGRSARRRFEGNSSQDLGQSNCDVTDAIRQTGIKKPSQLAIAPGKG